MVIDESLLQKHYFESIFSVETFADGAFPTKNSEPRYPQKFMSAKYLKMADVQKFLSGNIPKRRNS